VRLRLDVEREAEQHRAALDQRGAVGPPEVISDGRGGGDPVGQYADGRRQRGLVDVEVAGRLGCLGGEHEQRRA
jgi:hypothetical protein